MVKQILLAILLFGLISASYYPFAFNYGVKNATLEHGILSWAYPDGSVGEIAWDVSEFGVDSNGYVNTLVLEKQYGFTTVIFNRSDYSSTSSYQQVWFPKANNNDDYKLAYSVEQTVNMEMQNQVCKIESKGTYWQLNSLYPADDWLIERSLKLHNPLFNGAKWSWISNETWKIYKVV